MKKCRLFTFTNMIVFMLMSSLAISGQTKLQSSTKTLPVVNEAAQKGATSQKTGNPGARLIGRRSSATQAKSKSYINKEAGNLPTFWGNMVFANAWIDQSNVPYGVYSFTPASGMEFSSLKTGNAFSANGGSVFFNDKFHIMLYESFFGTSFITYYAYNTDTWTLEKTVNVPANSLMSITQAYDPTTGNTYGCFYKDDLEAEGYTFGTIDYTSLSREIICEVDQPYYTMAVNMLGELFAIDGNSRLYRIDKNTGKSTLVGSTGAKMEGYLQSMTFDSETGKLYWACASDAQNALYEVNTTTGKATKITDFPDNEEFSSLYINHPTNANAPGIITDQSAYFPNGELTGKITCFLPEKTHGGDALTGDVEYFVLANGDTIKTATGKAGGFVSAPATLQAGMNSYVLFAKNEAGEGKRISFKSWVGYDTPKEVKNPKAVNDGNGNITVTWGMPDGCVHNGYMDYKEIKYEVVRMPGETVLAEAMTGNTFKETIETDKLAAYYYKIRAINGDQKGDFTKTAKIIVGDPLEVPYFEDFTNDESFSLFTVIDDNNDGCSWEYNPVDGMVYNKYSNINSADDWLLTPGIRLKSDRKYYFSCKASSTTEGYVETISSSVGYEQSIYRFKEIVPATTFTGPSTVTLQTMFSVDTDTIYNFAMHATSQSGQGFLYVDSISVEEGPKFAAPDSVKNYTIKAGEDGAPEIKGSFTTPTQAINGTPLTEITKVEVFRNTETTPYLTIEKPEIDKEYTFYDEDLPNGFNTYTVVVWNGEGGGEKAAAKAYVGYDIPLPPKNIKLTDNLDGTATLTWQMPDSKGENGGYVNPSDLTYDIYKVENDIPVEFATDVEGNTYKVEGIPTTGEQDFVYFAMKSCYDSGKSGFTLSPWIASGAEYKLPFHEGFPAGKFDNSFWTIDSNSFAGFEVTQKQSNDGDNGLAQFISDNPGDMSILGSGKITIDGVENPKLKFEYYAMPDSNVVIKVNVRPNGGDPINIGEINFKDLDGMSGWRTAIFSLEAVRQSKYVLLNIHVTDNTGLTPVYIDNISVRNVLAHNISAKIKAPKYVTAGKDVTCNVMVENIGDNPASGYTLNLYANGQLVDIKAGETLQPGEMRNTDMTYKTQVNDPENTSLEVLVEYGNDMDQTDNTAETEVKLATPEYPAVDNLQAEYGSNTNEALLTWSKPVIEENVVTEDFENMDAFSINDFGNWTVDGNWTNKTTSWEDIVYPHAGEPFPFIVFRPSDIDFSMYPSMIEYSEPHSGKQYLASICNYSSKGNQAWLISPMISGGQTISFWAKSFSTYYGYEKFEVRYSTTDKDTTSFKNVLVDENRLSDKWKEYTVDLPEDALYFAIYVKSKDSFMFMIDDITYSPGVGQVLGYNIYRDNEYLNAVTAGSTSFTDKTAGGNAHDYNVSVLFPGGESKFSNTAQLMATSINGYRLDNNTLRVEGGNGSIRIFNATDKGVSVVAPNGSLTFIGKGTEKMDIPTQCGQYVVKVGRKAFNILVK